ncbi:MAG: hypothetical protein RMH75_06825 [Archaeoglobaceae archaeon]|nr:hypothetical protein [Archaeoglobaceae archaeon]MDW7990355.1 hypothetical protein [Archaeoglobaceae archaeon]
MKSMSDKFGELKTILIFGFIALIAEVALRFIIHHKSHFLWEEIPGFYAIFGFFGYILLSKFSKFLGYRILMKEPDYYERRCKR